ncbi:hypothetical protein HZA39_02855 [Candidatus Peregrinibacteria bacterium]|nr:hypothetical protein [Candidatus Peregrinibacteria bacterium]
MADVKLQFSKENLKELAYKSPALMELPADKRERFIGKLLEASDERQVRVFGILADEQEKLKEMDEKFKQEKIKIYENFLRGVEEAKRDYTRNVRKRLEEIEKKYEEKKSETLLTNL